MQGILRKKQRGSVVPSAVRPKRGAISSKWVAGVGAVALSTASVFAQGEGVTLPDIGVDIGDYVDAYATNYGQIVITVLGIAFVLMIIWKALSLVRRKAS